MSSIEQAASDEANVETFDFSNLDISKATARFDMPWVSPGAFVIVKPATSENTKYNVASLRMGGKRQRQIVATGSLSNAEAEEDRNEDRVLYPKYVAVGWGGVCKKGTDVQVPFTLPNSRAFFAKLPNWIFDRMRIFCMKPEQFLAAEDVDDLTEPNAVEIAEN